MTLPTTIIVFYSKLNINFRFLFISKSFYLQTPASCFWTATRNKKLLKKPPELMVCDPLKVSQRHFVSFSFTKNTWIIWNTYNLGKSPNLPSEWDNKIIPTHSLQTIVRYDLINSKDAISLGSGGHFLLKPGMSDPRKCLCNTPPLCETFTDF